MKLRIFTWLLVPCLILSISSKALATTESSASDGIYASAKILASAQTNWSYVVMEDTVDRLTIDDNWTNVTLGLAAAIGYDFYKYYDVPVRLDLEYTMRNQWSGSADVVTDFYVYKSTMDMQTLMLNAYYDFYNSSRFTPYITAGLGIAFIDAKVSMHVPSQGGVVHSESFSSPAWQIGAGVGIELTPNVTLDLGYKFLSFANFNYEIDQFFDDYHGDFTNVGTAHEIALGIRYTFGGENSDKDSDKTASFEKPFSGFYASAKILGSSQTNWSDIDTVDTTTGKAFPFSEVRSQMIFGAAINLGYDLYPRYEVPVRLDIEYSMRKQWQSASDYVVNYIGIGTVELHNTFNVNTLMLNAYYDFHNSSRFTPYVTAGAGLAFINSSLDVKEKDRGTSNTEYFTRFAWQVGAGLGIEITPHVTLDIGYKYLNFGAFNYSASGISTKLNPDFTNNDFSNVSSAHEIAVGLRYTF